MEGHWRLHEVAVHRLPPLVANERIDKGSVHWRTSVPPVLPLKGKQYIVRSLYKSYNAGVLVGSKASGASRESNSEYDEFETAGCVCILHRGSTCWFIDRLRIEGRNAVE